MKKSIVLGGTSGIGLEVAQSLKSNGMTNLFLFIIVLLTLKSLANARFAPI